jgi:hypothetical protein
LVSSQIMFLLKSKSFEDLTMVISLTVTNVLMILRTLNFMVKVDKVEELFQTIEKVNHEFGEGRELNTMKFLDKICKSIWFEIFVLCFSSILVPITTDELALKLWFPFEFEKGGLVFWIIAVVQMVVICTISGIDIIIEIWPTILIGAILDLMKKLTENVESLMECEPVDEECTEFLGEAKEMGSSSQKKTETLKKFTLKATKRSKLIHKNLENCIEFHLKITDIKKKVEQIFSPTLLAHAVISTLILCSSVHKLSMVSSSTTL